MSFFSKLLASFKTPENPPVPHTENLSASKAASSSETDKELSLALEEYGQQMRELFVPTLLVILPIAKARGFFLLLGQLLRQVAVLHRLQRHSSAGSFPFGTDDVSLRP
jgi:hypothetical protein